MSLNKTAQRVLAVMRSHGSITPRSFRAPTIDGGDEMDRLAARINEIRDEGYFVETAMETSPRGKRYARYTLKSEPNGQPVKPPAAMPQDTGPLSLWELPGGRGVPHYNDTEAA